MTSAYTKLAWIRDAAVAVGHPAPGHFDCPCGAQILTDPRTFNPRDTFACVVCGLTVDARGWVLIPSA